MSPIFTWAYHTVIVSPQRPVICPCKVSSLVHNHYHQTVTSVTVSCHFMITLLFYGNPKSYRHLKRGSKDVLKWKITIQVCKYTLYLASGVPVICRLHVPYCSFHNSHTHQNQNPLNPSLIPRVIIYPVLLQSKLTSKRNSFCIYLIGFLSLKCVCVRVFIFWGQIYTQKWPKPDKKIIIIVIKIK